MYIFIDIKKFIFYLFLCSFCFCQIGLPFNFGNMRDKDLDSKKVNELLKEFSSQKQDTILNKSSKIIGPLKIKKIPTNESDIKQAVEQVLDNKNIKNDVTVNQLKNLKNNSKPDESNESTENDLLINKDALDEIKKQTSDQLMQDINDIKEKENFFGYSIFSNVDISQFFDPYEPIDPNYIIGPGDEIILMLWGETELFNSYYISKEGFIFIPNIGQVFVNGLTLEKLEKKLFKLLKKAYSSLDPSSGSAKSFFDLSLGSSTIRPIQVTLLGEVESAGVKNLKSSISFFNSLLYFGGPKTSGSLRNVKLIRDDKEIISIDLYDYILTGKKGKDVRLQRNDVIFFPQKNKSVFISGEINRPKMHFELKDNEGLKDLISIAGGIKPRTYLKRVQILRRLTPEKRLEVGYNTTLLDIDITNLFDSDIKIDLYDGDEINFFSVDDIIKNYVNISGPVRMPGRYSIGDKLSLKELLKAAGIKDNVYTERIDIFRKNQDLTESLITLNLSKILESKTASDIELLDSDNIILYDKRDMMDRQTVSIDGFVTSPGEKKLRFGMNVSDLLFLGGGFEKKSRKEKTYFQRAEFITFKNDGFSKKIIPFRLDSALSGDDFSKRVLKNKDRIRIYSKDEVEGLIENSVEITGFVKKPGRYALFDDNMTIHDLLFSAGGIDDTLHLSRMYSKRADIIRYDNNYVGTQIIRFNLNEVLNDKNSAENFKLRNKDKIIVYSKEMFNDQKTVSIDGIVKNPGSFQLSDNTNLKDLILQAGGVTENVYRFRADIARINPKSNNENKYAEIITVDLNNDLTIFDNFGGFQKIIKEDDFRLKNYDVVTLRPDPNFSLQKKVTINGEVYYPGNYVITGPNERVSDIINRAGGLKPGGYAHASSLTRNGQIINLSFDKIIKFPRSKFNFEIMPEDILTIGKKSKLVIVNGEVNSPGNYQYIKGYKFKDYIKLAGGFTRKASKYYSYVRYPDGTSKKVDLLASSIKVKDGSTIIVGRKEELQIEFTEFLNNLTSVVAQVTQTMLIIVALQNSL